MRGRRRTAGTAGFLTALGVLAAAVVAAAAVAGPPATAAPVAPGQAPGLPAPQVQHPLRATAGDGARIVDDRGRTVLLRGVNVNALGEYHQEWPDLPATVPLTEADFAAIAAHGFDVVRLLITWSSLEPERGTIDEAYLDRVVEAIGWARAHDIYVLLDMHQDAWGPWVSTPDGVACPPLFLPAVGWDGAPRWATALAGTVATCRLELGREFSIAVQTSFERFYLDIGGIQGALVDAWAAVAGRVAGDPTVAGYDLLNEPNPGLTAGVDDYVLLGSFYDRALRSIRAAESAAGGLEHIGFFEPSVLTGPLALPGPLPGFTGDRNLVYAPHLYNESISPLPFSMEDGFANAATAARRYGTTFFSGEWGWFGDPVADLAKVERYAALEDRYRIGGTWWQWKQACGDPHAIGVRGHRPPCAAAGEPYSDGLVVAPDSWRTVLTRAYPRAAPGHLTALSADVAGGGLTLAGTADRPGVEADLWVPERCASPAVDGRNVAAATVVAVPGGWRIAVPVPEPGPYEIAVGCAPPPPSPEPAPAAAVSSRPEAPAAGGAPELAATGAAGGALSAAAAAVAAAAALRARRR